MKQIENFEDIQLMVNTFYSNVRKDELIGPIFERVIEDRWDEHLEKLHRFWQSILLGENTYNGAPFPPHAKLPISFEHFDRWLSIFKETVDGLFIGEKAENAKFRAENMAKMFSYKIDYIRSQQR